MFAEVRDIALRSPEQAARIAANLHILAHGPQEALRQPMAVAIVEAAVAIARWHLFEAKRVLADGDITVTADDAKKILRSILARGGTAARRDIKDYVNSRSLRTDTSRRQLAIDWLIRHRLVIAQTQPATLIAHPDSQAILDAADNLR
jgi:hypothetical protein